MACRQQKQAMAGLRAILGRNGWGDAGSLIMFVKAGPSTGSRRALEAVLLERGRMVTGACARGPVPRVDYHRHTREVAAPAVAGDSVAARRSQSDPTKKLVLSAVEGAA